MAEASDMRSMLSRCLTATGMPWLTAASLRKVAYTCRQYTTDPCEMTARASDNEGLSAPLHVLRIAPYIGPAQIMQMQPDSYSGSANDVATKLYCESLLGKAEWELGCVLVTDSLPH